MILEFVMLYHSDFLKKGIYFNIASALKFLFNVSEYPGGGALECQGGIRLIQKFT